MKFAVADLFYRLRDEQDCLQVEIAGCRHPKAGTIAIGRWLELDAILEELAEAVLRLTQVKPSVAKILNSRVRELRLNAKLGSRWTEGALKTTRMEVCDENGAKLSPRAIDPRFSR